MFRLVTVAALLATARTSIATTEVINALFFLSVLCFDFRCQVAVSSDAKEEVEVDKVHVNRRSTRHCNSVPMRSGCSVASHPRASDLVLFAHYGGQVSRPSERGLFYSVQIDFWKT